MDVKKISVKVTSAILNRFYDLFINGKNRPAFFNISKTYPDLLQLDHHYNEIKSELDGT